MDDLNIDDFEFDDDLEEEMSERNTNFIDSQEEFEVVNDCESGACAI